MHCGPAAVRYPRGIGPNTPIDATMAALPIGKGVVRREGQTVAILNFGTLLETALPVADKLGATAVDMRFVKPLDETLLDAMAQKHQLLVTIEDNTVQGGAGSAVAEYFNRRGIQVNLLQLGLPDLFVDHGTRAQQLAQCGLDEAGIELVIHRRLVQLGISAPVMPVRNEAKP
jgi:1-deoxy-D-xylulose-5-phosphate synthase